MIAQRRERLKTALRDFPDPPLFPGDLSKESLDAYRLQQVEWWSKFKTLIVEMDNELSRK